MDTFAEIADERRGLADRLSGLTPEQRASPSLCGEWTVQEVVGHLIVPLVVSTPRLVLAVLVSGGSFDRANTTLARAQARRPYGEMLDLLRRRAESRFTPPGAGPEAPLTDLLVHGLDIRRPLLLERRIPEERLQKSLTFLTSPPGRGLVPKALREGLRFQAVDIDWAHGTGPTVSGSAEALLLTLTGRAAALDELAGDGVAELRSRRP